MKLEVKKTQSGYFKMFVDGVLFVNLYQVEENSFRDDSIKAGEWIINRAGKAIDEGYFFPGHSYPTLKLAVGTIASVLPW